MVHEKLAEIQKKLKAPKGQLNKFGGYKYRSCEDILEAVKPLLGDAILTISDEIVLIGERYYVKAKATLSQSGDPTDSITVFSYAREEETKKGMDASQITGAASSYARKYCLNGLLLIDDTKDADHTQGQEPPKQPAPAPTIPQPDILLPAPSEPSKTVSEAQIKRLFTLADKSDKSRDEIKLWLKERGMQSSKELTNAKYDELVTWIETPKSTPKVQCPDGGEKDIEFCEVGCVKKDGCPMMEGI